jgi:hypothetical protein
MQDQVLKQNEANEAQKRATAEKNRIYKANYKKAKSICS